MGNVRPPTNKEAQDPLLKYGMKPKRASRRYLKCCVVTTLVIVLLLLLVCTILFVGLPFAFKYLTELQRNLIFPTCDLWPSDPEFSNFRKYHVEGARNLHVVVSEAENVSLGVWHVLPHALVNESLEDDFNYTAAIVNSKYPIVLHFHGNGGNRIADVEMYEVLRLFFHVIAFDYRGYADSSPLRPSEEGIVQDSVQLYKWVRMQTEADIYLWGHSLGSALGTHTAAKLRDEGIVPAGLFLEAPFTTLREEIEQIPLTKLFSWLPWYNSTMLEPLDSNGFVFETTRHIRKVDCPVMIVHAKDDSNIPYTLGQELYEIARDTRNSAQGNVTFHLLPADLHCDHMEIYKAKELPNYIRDHISICKEFSKGKG